MCRSVREWVLAGVMTPAVSDAPRPPAGNQARRQTFLGILGFLDERRLTAML
jgi:hypothetical protein